MGSLTVPLSTATLLPQCQSKLLNFSLFTEILIVVTGVIQTSMTRVEDLSIIQTQTAVERKRAVDGEVHILPITRLSRSLRN